MQAFLGTCEVIDWQAASIREQAERIAGDKQDTDAIGALFAWVRDSIRHTGDAGRGKLTLRASDVLRERTGLCYAKSHLLVALLRARNIPAGLCYQRLIFDESVPSYVLHGLVGVLIRNGHFLRIDPRGNKPGVDAQFVPGREALAFELTAPGEAHLPGVFARPIPQVVDALLAMSDWHPTQTALPDLRPEDWPTPQAQWHKPSG